MPDIENTTRNAITARICEICYRLDYDSFLTPTRRIILQAEIVALVKKRDEYDKATKQVAPDR